MQYNCPICSGILAPSFTAIVLGKHRAQYDVCNSCGFLKARDPHWLDEAYSSAIATADTGLVIRNTTLSAKLAGVLYWVLGVQKNERYLDAAGGYGMLVRMMRDLGFDFYWQDKYSSNLLARGFEYDPDLGACAAVTAIEVLEHLSDPAGFIRDVMTHANATTFIFTTELYEGAPPAPEEWWYYTFGTGQHIGFFQLRTLQTLAKKLGLTFTTANGIHILSQRPISRHRLALATGRFTSQLSLLWIKRRLASKTMSDHPPLSH